MARDIPQLAGRVGRDLLLAFLVQAEHCARTGCALCRTDAADFRAALALTAGSPAIICPACRSVSYNTHDVAERYCGRCHRFHDELDTA